MARKGGRSSSKAKGKVGAYSPGFSPGYAANQNLSYGTRSPMVAPANQNGVLVQPTVVRSSRVPKSLGIGALGGSQGRAVGRGAVYPPVPAALSAAQGPVFSSSPSAQEFFASRANANFAQFGITGYEGVVVPSLAGPVPVAVPRAPARRSIVGSTVFRQSQLRVSALTTARLPKAVTSRVRVASKVVVAAPAVAVRSKTVTLASKMVGDRLVKGKTVDVRCKARPTDNRPDPHGGGGGSFDRKFVPWC